MKKGKKLLTLVFILSVFLLLSISFTSASLLGDVGKFINNFFEEKITGKVMYTTNVNVALNKPATENVPSPGTANYRTSPSKAIDGDTSTWWATGNYNAASMTVDLQAEYTIDNYNLMCGGLASGNKGTIHFYNSAGVEVATKSYVCNPRTNVYTGLSGSFSPSLKVKTAKIDASSPSGGDWINVMEFQLWQTITSCIPDCSGKTCGDNGCSGSCGSCASGQTCTNGNCVTNCVPKTCSQLGKSCGSVDDGCGTQINCGSCASGQTCTNGNCVTNCVPKTCSQLGKSCGSVDDGCGTQISCGSCASGQTCSNGNCVSHNDLCANKNCNDDNACTDDSCSNGNCINTQKTCSSGQICSNGNCVSNCVPKTCSQLGKSCGSVDDGCGIQINCGNCPSGQTCTNGNCLAIDPKNVALNKPIIESVPSPGKSSERTSPSKAVDGNSGTWWATGNFNPASMTLDLQAEYAIDNYNLMCGGLASGNKGTIHFYNSAGVEVATKSYVCNPRTNVYTGLSGNFSPPIKVKTAKIDASSPSGGDWINIQEFQLWQTITSCVPDCSGKSCGDDGCSGSCGNCASGQTCSNGNCVAPSDLCANKNCNDNNACTDDSCSNGNCINTQKTCSSGQTCNNGNCVAINNIDNNISSCIPKTCSQLGKSCGSVDDGCGIQINCENCASGQTCSEGKCIKTPCNFISKALSWIGLADCSENNETICIQKCEGKSCGDNGCGGSCGSLNGNCPDNQICSDGKCVNLKKNHYKESVGFVLFDADNTGQGTFKLNNLKTSEGDIKFDYGNLRRVSAATHELSNFYYYGTLKSMSKIPIAGDWDGDSIDTIGLYDPYAGTFELKNSNSAGNANMIFAFGKSKPVPSGRVEYPIAGDWDGDGIDTVGLYDSNTGTFYLRNSNTAGVADLTFKPAVANTGWIPIAGDWDGDGIDTIGLYYSFVDNSDTLNPSRVNMFYLLDKNEEYVTNKTTIITIPEYSKITPTEDKIVPIAGDWDGDGKDEIGLYDYKYPKFYLKDTLDFGNPDKDKATNEFVFSGDSIMGNYWTGGYYVGGTSNYFPIAGNWNNGVLGCTPSCINKLCGNDGCGESCGTCNLNMNCINNKCQSCISNTCDGFEKKCGYWDDGCGTQINCGICKENQKCDSNGNCINLVDQTIVNVVLNKAFTNAIPNTKGSSPANAIDGNPNTFWSFEYWDYTKGWKTFDIDLGSDYDIYNFSVTCGKMSPRGMSVWIYLYDSNMNKIGDGVGLKDGNWMYICNDNTVQGIINSEMISTSTGNVHTGRSKGYAKKVRYIKVSPGVATSLPPYLISEIKINGIKSESW